MWYKREDPIAPCPQWCIMCKESEEQLNHLFLHCPVVLRLWHRLFCLVEVLWVAPGTSFQILLIDFRGFGGKKRAKVLWMCAVYSIFWVIQFERNARIFEDKFGDLDSLLEKVCSLASFWALVAPPLRGIPLFLISRDWMAGCAPHSLFYLFVLSFFSKRTKYDL